MLHSHQPVRSLQQWLSPLRIKSLPLHHRLTSPASTLLRHDHPTAVNVNGAAKKLRGLYAADPIRAGDVIAVIPAASCLDGRRAWSIAMTSLGLGSGSDAARFLHDEIREMQRRGEETTHHRLEIPVFSRDFIAISLSLSHFRLLQQGNVVDAAASRDEVTQSWGPWISTLPKSVADLGWVLRQCDDNRHREEEGMRRKGSLRPTLSRGEKFPLPLPQRMMPSRHVTVPDVAQVMSQFDFFLTNLQMRRQSVGVVGPAQDGMRATHDASTFLEAARWGFFMARSRCLCLSTSSSMPQSDPSENTAPVLVPLVDMLNHACTPNVSVAHPSEFVLNAIGAVSTGDVIISAVRNIQQGEELTLNYGDHAQRYELMLKPRNHVRSSQGEPPPTFDRRQAVRRKLADSTEKDAMKTLGVVDDDIAWAWQFGFERSKDDKDHLAKVLFTDRLQQRVEHMLNRSRAGESGEYVVHVPQGASELQDARRALEREQYRGQVVFPPQCD